MDRRDAMGWVLSVCIGGLRRSQAKTLSVLVVAMLSLQRISLAHLGRAVAGMQGQGGMAKHSIKRAWRFISNPRIEPALAMSAVLQSLLRKRKRPLLVTLDWTDIRGMQTLMAAAVVKGRAVPLMWASCAQHVYDGHRSRNSFEESLLLSLRAALPTQLPVIILADRGFGRTELGRFCQRYHFHYVIRIVPKVWVQIGMVKTRLDRYPVHKGQCFRLSDVGYRAAHDPLTQHVVVRWKKGLPKQRDECWYLMSDLPQSARQLSDLYGKRMEIEQFFRDAKNKRQGWSLRDTGITRPDRLDRLILIMALAYLLLVAVGLYAQAHYRSGHWASNQRRGEYSTFHIGQFMLDHVRINLPRLLLALINACLSVMPKWG